MTRQQLIEQIRQKRSFLCVGLDPDVDKIPQELKETVDEEMGEDASEADRNALYILTFNKLIIDATAPYCVAYKPNLAFYEAYGISGYLAYMKTIQHLQKQCPNHFVIADAKRGDIGNTSAMYARTFFVEQNVDALTVAPYMGEDSVKPFLGYDGKWVVLLALTSNKGSKDFQLTADNQGNMLYERVLKTSQQWGTEENMMYVVGATQGRSFENVRRLVPRHFLLVPGVGAQGGSLEEVCRYGMNEDCGLLVNSSRGILYASSGEDFVERAVDKARELNLQMAEELDKAGL